MSAKPTKRNWNDVQTAIATAAIVTTLGMWNLFAAPAKTATAQVEEPTLPPTEPPTEPPAEPTALPYVKIMFTPNAPVPTTVAAQSQAQSAEQQQAQKKKKRDKRKNGGGGGGGSGASVTNTQSS